MRCNYCHFDCDLLNQCHTNNLQKERLLELKEENEQLQHQKELLEIELARIKPTTQYLQ